MPKYLEIDSTYRDRNTWPLPGQFQILLSPQNNITATSATDPVSTSTPIKEWQSNRFQVNAFNSPTITGTVTNDIEYSIDSIIVTFQSSIPNSLQQQDNYYRHVLFSWLTFSARIISYKYMGNDKATVGLSTSATDFTIPIGTIVTLTDETNFSTLTVFIPSSPEYPDNFYAGTILYDETANNYSPIDFFDCRTGMVTVRSAIPGWSTTDAFSIRTAPPLLVGITGAGSNNVSINLGGGSPVVSVGSFIRLDPIYPASAPAGETRRILTYDPVTFIATVNPAFTLSSTVGLAYEILPFSYDNNVPFVYNGTTQNEFVTNDVKLLNLTLPSTTLAVGYGGKILDYPYVYVQLTPLNTVNNNISSSNNPNAVATLFRAVKAHNDHDDSIFFSNFHGDGMIQRVKFKMENDFDFKVSLPNGQTFQTIKSDTKSPAAPDPLVQISALFEIIRPSVNMKNM